MAMGSYNPHNMYRAQNPMGNANALLGLLKAKSDEYGKITQAVDDYGQSRVRGKASELMATKDFQNKDRAGQQAALALATGGRDLGDNFMKTIKMSDDNAADNQSNTWKENAATKLFGRQNSQMGQRHANSVSMENMRQKNKQALGIDGMPINTKAKNAYMELMAKTTDPVERKKIAQEAFLNGNLNKNDRIGMEKLGLLDGITKGETKQLKDAIIPKEVKIGVGSAGLAGLQKGVNSGQLVVLPYTVTNKKTGREYTKYKVLDSMGNKVSTKEYSRFQ
jgi:hypothetical protein